MSAVARKDADGRRLVGKKDLCSVLKWSRPTLDKRLKADPNFPVHQRGTQQGGWEFDVDAVLAYLQAGVLSDTASDATTAEEPIPLQAAGARLPPASVRVEHLGEATARQRRDLAQALWQEDRLRARRGELVEAAEVRNVISTMLGRLATNLQSLPDQIVRRFDLPEASALIIREMIDRSRRAMVDDLRTLISDEPAD